MAFRSYSSCQLGSRPLLQPCLKAAYAHHSKAMRVAVYHPSASLTSCCLSRDMKQAHGLAAFSQEQPGEVMPDTLSRGELVAGTVQGVVEFGAFVDLDCGVTGLIHKSQISNKHVSDPREVFSRGQQVKAVVLDNRAGRLSLSTKVLEQSHGDMLIDPEAVYQEAEGHREELVAKGRQERHQLQEQKEKRKMEQAERQEQEQVEQKDRSRLIEQFTKGDVVRGEVLRVEEYGAFVELENGATALLHISQITAERLKTVKEVFQPGEKVTAIVLRVDHDRGRISISTKKLEKNRGDMLRDRELVYSTTEELAARLREQDEY